MGDFYNQVTHFIPDYACKDTHFYPNNKNYRMIFLLIPVKDLIIMTSISLSTDRWHFDCVPLPGLSCNYTSHCP